MSWSSSPSCHWKQQKSAFCRVSISPISLALSLIVSTFAVPEWIQLFPVGLPPWPAVACTNISPKFDTAFIQYWDIRFYSWMPFLMQTCYQPRKRSIFKWDTILPENTSNKNNMQPAKLYINTKNKGRDLRCPTLAYCHSSVSPQ